MLLIPFSRLSVPASSLIYAQFVHPIRRRLCIYHVQDVWHSQSIRPLGSWLRWAKLRDIQPKNDVIVNASIPVA
jgi:hypothetical protein